MANETNEKINKIKTINVDLRVAGIVMTIFGIFLLLVQVFSNGQRYDVSLIVFLLGIFMFWKSEKFRKFIH